ncbi:MAG: Abi family protein [Bacteroidales bacterium]|nr:Abi family protein [Bacteroidales bacterium]
MFYLCSNRTRLHPLRTAGESFFYNNESKSKNNSAANSYTQIKRNPDAWMIFETATFGTLSKMYKNLKNQSPLKSRIANELGLYSARDLSSWLEAISVLRNTIAHHSRIWYRIFSKKPTNIRGHRYDWMAQDMTEHQRKRAFGVISCLLYLCNAINPVNTIKDDIKTLFRSMPDVPIFMIGFSRGWENNPLWK